MPRNSARKGTDIANYDRGLRMNIKDEDFKSLCVWDEKFGEILVGLQDC